MGETPTKKSFRYTVESREAGNYAEQAGQWQTEYMGKDAAEALEEAQREASKGRDVRVSVEKVPHG
jgi:hypothetical protein